MGLLAKTWKNIRRTPYQTLATLLVMTFTLFLSGIFILLAFSAQKVLYYFETKPQVSAFFDEELPKERVAEIRKKLEQTGKMSSFRYVSKKEAFETYKNLFKNEPQLLEMVSEEILPSSIEVSAYNPRELQSLAEILKKEEGVQEVKYLKDIVENLIFWTEVIKTVGIVLLLLLGMTSVLVILIVVGMKISSRKKEMGILNLLGATKWYISSPFLLEGVFYGFSGAFVSWILLFTLYFLFKPYVVSFFEGIPLFPLPPVFWLLFLGTMLFLGSLTGFLGSSIALKRHIRRYEEI